MLTIAEVSTAAGQIFAASSSDGDGGGFGFVFLLSGFLFYGAIYLRYRNVDKRHKHESETQATLQNVQEHDAFVTSKKGLTNRSMSGANNTAVRGMLRKFF
ncbi:hypothetical protein FB472_0317 [Rhodoglobus vestalii]|uniref:Uncharacterized protein n=1 Tax=Rhodoglobus vestalii TaxID=193384 RepID=A0A8H2K4G6_9MICO|nr:hypothetical protein FB472_0317 [Rhodoglobus vestalii]